MDLTRVLTPRRPGPAPAGALPVVTRRGLAALAGGGFAAGVVPAAAAAPSGLAALDRPALDTLLRGVAALDAARDAGLSAQAEAMVAGIAEVWPEARPLAELYRLFPAGQSEGGVWRRPVTVDMGVIEAAVSEARPLTLRYRDLKGEETLRDILPLALVYPDHGVFVLAWCCLRGGYRQFFAHAMLELAPGAGSFAGDRLALLEGLAAHHAGRG